MPQDKLTGNDVIVNIQTGETPGNPGATPPGLPEPIFELIAFQRGVSYEQTREMIDASHKGSDHSESLYGRASSSLSLDGLMANPEVGAVAAHDALYAAMNNKTELVLQYVKRGTATDGSDDTVKQARALVGTISEEGPDNDVATISCEFTLQEPLRAA